MENSWSIKDRNENFQRVDTDYLRRRREQNAISLRKRKRLEYSYKKRVLNCTMHDNHFPIEKGLIFPVEWVPAQVVGRYPALADDSLDKEQRYRLFLEALSNDSTADFDLLQILQKTLSAEKFPDLSLIFKYNIHSKLISVLKSGPLKSQYQSLWSLINISLNEQTLQLLINEGILETLEHLLTSQDKYLKYNTIWIFGNIAFEPAYIDHILPFAPAILSILSHTSDAENISICLYALGALFQRTALPGIYTEVLDKIKKHYFKLENSQIKYECLRILANISNGDNQRVQAVISTELVPSIINICSGPSGILQKMALKVIGNILAGDNLQTEYVLSLGFLDKLKILLNDEKSAIKKEAFWALSNIFAGTLEQIRPVLNHECYQVLINGLGSYSALIKNEAVWCFTHLTQHAYLPFVYNSIVRTSAFDSLIEMLDDTHSDIVINVLICLKNLFSVNSQPFVSNEAAARFSSAGGINKLEKLQGHPNKSVCEVAISIIQEIY